MILGDLYYALGFLILLVLFFIISQFSKFYQVRDWVMKYNKVIGSEPEKKDFRSESEYSDYITFQVFTIIEFIWTFMGLLTHSWLIFGSIILYTILTSFIRVRIGFEPLKKLATLQLFWVKFITTGWLIMNHFHFHQSLF